MVPGGYIALVQIRSRSESSGYYDQLLTLVKV